MVVLLKNDLSLNRRLFTWMLGGRNEEADSEYFREYAMENVLQSLKELFMEKPKDISQVGHPFKVSYLYV